jgi:hypothetical protein
MGMRTLFSRRGLRPRLQAIKLLASLAYIHSTFVSLHHTKMRPCPHRCRTWHQSPRGRQAKVVPTPEAPIAATRGRRSSPPSPQAQYPMSRSGAQGGQSHGYGSPPPHE